ncbi:MAG: hypothetical protein KKF42_03500 [Actinobacteria bacterium]|nr:hypothetical protein [Actinomycetota bacterium]
MRIAKKWVAVAAGLLAFALVGGSLPAASAAPGDPLNPQSNGSEGGLFVYSNTGALIDDPSYVFARTEPLFGSGSQAHVMAAILGTSEATTGSTETYTFISSAANLRASGTDSWEAWAPGALPEGGIVAPTLTASDQSFGNGSGLSGVFADVGGTYYLGVAFTKNNGITVDSAVYRTMHILSGNRFSLGPVEIEPAAGTADQQSADGTGALGAESPMGFEPLNATAATETFELIMPAAGTIDLGEVQRNGSTALPATLGQFTVIADRSVEPGWELNVLVSDFVSGEHLIAANALGYSPVSANPPLPDGIALGSAKAAGSGTFGPISTGAAGSTTSATGVAFNLSFAFAPPVDAAAGTYTSTVSLDLVSH